jgi:hypothetical protein
MGHNDFLQLTSAPSPACSSSRSIMTLGCDFQITQLVDSNLGYHFCCSKVRPVLNTSPTSQGRVLVDVGTSQIDSGHCTVNTNMREAFTAMRSLWAATTRTPTSARATTRPPSCRRAPRPAASARVSQPLVAADCRCWRCFFVCFAVFVHPPRHTRLSYAPPPCSCQLLTCLSVCLLQRRHTAATTARSMATATAATTRVLTAAM